MKKSNNSNDYELFETEYIKYNTSDLNLDRIKIFLIKMFKGTLLDNNEYKIKVNQENKTIKQTIISILFEHDTMIKRNFRIKKVLQ